MADREYLGGVTNTTMHIEHDGTIHIEDFVDAEPIMEYAKAAKNHRFSADACDGMLRHEAEIPIPIYINECRRIGVRPFSREGDAAIENIIKDPMYSVFRTAPTVRDPRVIIRGRR